MKFTVNQKIFEKYPNVILGIIHVSDLQNKKEFEKEDAMEFLQGHEANVREFLKENEITDLSVVQNWREIFQSFGSKPSKFKSSIEALLRREKKGEALPDINPLVNFYNALSLHYKIPFGAEDLTKIVGNVELTFSDGTVACQLIGDNEPKLADEGEVVYKDDVGAICRKWCWRESDRTKITEETTDAFFVIEFNDGDLENAKQVVAETIDAMNHFFDVKTQSWIVNKDNNEIEIPFGTKQEGEKLVVQERKESAFAKASADKRENKVYQPKTNIEAKVFQVLSLVVKEKFGEEFVSDIELEHPADESHGDLATNIAMKLAGRLKRNPREIAQEIFEELDPMVRGMLKKGDRVTRVTYFDFPNGLIGDVKIAGSGFINFFIHKESLVSEIKDMNESYGKSSKYSGQKVLLEHTSANPNKAMHIGHVRNNILGNSLIKLLEAVGYEVTADYIVNDRGASISKVMWGYLNFAQKQNNQVLSTWEDIKVNLAGTNFDELLSTWNNSPEQWLTPEDFENLKSDEMMEKVYVLASHASKELDWVDAQVSKILVDWESEIPENRKLWKQILDWVFSGQKKTMARMGSRTDHFWFESDFYKEGKEIVTEGLEKGVFRKDGTAIITNFEEHGLPDTIVIKSDGTALYITQDLKLTELKTQKFPSNKYIWVVGAEQKLTLQQAFLADHLLGIVDKEKLYHFAYGLFTTASGEKIGSRKGNVVSADNLLDLVTDSAKSVIEEKGLEYSEDEKRNIAEKVGIGALKYFILKSNPLSSLKFDAIEATSFDGNTGPYLQYTYARAKSILRDSDSHHPDSFGITPPRAEGENLFVADSEMALLRTLYRFPESVINAAENYAPNYVADYIFDLAQKFNAFYRECPVLSAEDSVKNSRLLLTASVAQVLKNGLNLLGIETLERM